MSYYHQNLTPILKKGIFMLSKEMPDDPIDFLVIFFCNRKIGGVLVSTCWGSSDRSLREYLIFFKLSILIIDKVIKLFFW